MLSSRLTPSSRQRLQRKGGYHHGQLRRALLDAALVLIEREGPERFALRAAARAAGVSTAAPYHHFPHKNALLAALALEGFELLRAEVATAAQSTGSTPVRALEMAIAYVRFAVMHPTRFRLMLGRDGRAALADPALAVAAARAFELMRGALVPPLDRELARAAVPDDELVLGAWALVHGLAFLALDGHLGELQGDFARCEAVVRRTLIRMAAPFAADPSLSTKE